MAIEVLQQVAAQVLAALGLKGVIGAGALLSTLTMLHWGYRLSHLTALFRTVSAVAFKYGAVSIAVASVVLGGALYAGIIPGVDVAKLQDILAVVIETVTPSGGGGVL